MASSNGVVVLIDQAPEIPEDLQHLRNGRLRILTSRFKKYDDLVKYPNIIDLEIFNYTHDSLTPIGALTNLRQLKMTHFPKVRSLQPLSRLKELEELELRTLPSWDGCGKRMVVDSLRPLSGLKELRTFGFTVVAKDRDLSPLARLKNLRTLVVPNLYPQKQLAMLAGRLPNVRREGFLHPYVEFDSFACKKCGTNKIMLSGADIRPKVICPNCQSKKFTTCVNRFEEIMREFA